MDAFAKKMETSWRRNNDDDDNDNNNEDGAGNPRKRCRKRLVEKTTMDDKGYLHTENVSVWEDVTDDSEILFGAAGRPAAETRKPGRPEEDIRVVSNVLSH